MNEATGEREEPDDGKENGETSYHFGVDETALVPTVGIFDGMEILPVDSSDNSSKRQLRKAEDHGEDVCQDHLDCM